MDQATIQLDSQQVQQTRQARPSQDGASLGEKTVRSSRVYDLADGKGPEPRPADPAVAAAAERLAGRRGYLAAKRVFDVAFSVLVLVCLCWLFGLIALAIKLDDPSGPAIFRQRRVGRGGREFTMYKFRSMRPDAESRLGELEALNEKTGPVFKMRDDPRVTRVGRILRKTSLDELPQFANVLKGDIPSRILKMRQVFSAKKPGAFALPATEVRTNKAVFPQVKGVSEAGLRTLRCAPSHSTASSGIISHFFAKRVFHAFEGRLNTLCEVVTVA